jgi:hypothetical protein
MAATVGKSRPKQTNINLHPEAETLMRQIVGDRRGKGQYLSRLIFEDAVRRELRGAERSQAHAAEGQGDV